MLLQKLVGATEMPIADEAAISRERRRMDRFQYQVFAGINQLFLALRMGAPEHEHQMPAALAGLLYHPVGEMLPANLGVRTRIGLFNGQ